jgi:zinc protease
MNVADVHELQLDNGFRALLLERRGLPVVASMVWYRVGSRDEHTAETGLSHFLEHMMFKGTDRFAKGEIDLLTSKMGGSNNAFTDTDVTAYHFSLAADRWHTALEIEANRMRQCRLDSAEFEAEKRVVLEELAMGEDHPWNGLAHAMGSLVYQVHPYHHPVIGWKGDLEQLRPERMRAYYDRHYGPNRAFLVAVGDFDAVATASRVRELFGDLPASAAEREAVLAEPPQAGERRAVIRFPGNLTRMAFAVRSCRVAEDDDFSLDVLATIAGNGRTSRLFQRLVEREQLATAVMTHNETRLDPGLFWIGVELRPGASADRAEALVRQELARLAETGPTAAELMRAKVQLRAAFQFEEETVLDLATKLGQFEAMAPQGFRLAETVLERYATVDRRRVQEALQRYFGRDSWNVVWSLPLEQAGAGNGKPAARARTRRAPLRHAPRKARGVRGKRTR